MCTIDALSSLQKQSFLLIQRRVDGAKQNIPEATSDAQVDLLRSTSMIIFDPTPILSHPRFETGNIMGNLLHGWMR